MAETHREETRRSRERALATNHLSLEINKIPRDLLRGFMSVSTDSAVRYSRSKTFCEDDCKDGDDEIELSLGLSLGGRFGIDKTPGKLKRSSSIAGTMPIFREQAESESSAAAVAAAGKPLNCNFTPGLTRTTSLPTEMEEEWSKRKEIQTLRRMEAKRRRFTKQKSSRISSSGNCDTHPASFGLESWVTAAATVGSDDDGCDRGGEGSSLCLSELDSKNQQGSSDNYGEETSPKYITRCSSHREAENLGMLVATEKPGMRRCNSIDGRGKERGAAMVNMPCVFTKGEGPNGRRIEGILYKYGKGEEVRIICVCHGSFLSPAEFVRHAGGGDVDHPLRHIVVNTSSSAASLFL